MKKLTVRESLADTLKNNAKKAGVASLCAFASLSTNAAFNETPPTTGAYDSGTHRNLFAEIGKTGIQTKVNDTFNTMFYGAADEKLYYDFDNDESYIKTIDTSDIRSEGMSWGMMIAVQMDKQAEFDRLWRFAYNRMRNADGTYAWQAEHVGNSVNIVDAGSAPDGEEYFAAALFSAAGRWGNGTGELNYQARANELLGDIKAKLMHPTEKQVIFAPSGSAAQITDPSYHIPAFYDYWADVADSDNAYWADVADISRTFLQNHLAQGNGGLATYQANFDGTTGPALIPGMLNPSNVYEGDAWRVLMNIGMDAHLFGAETWHQDAVNNAYYFFRTHVGFNANGICGDGYSQKYNHDGSEYGTCGTDNWKHGNGQKATNASAAFASNNAVDAEAFLNELWNDPWPTGTYRYYHGCLKMFGMLSASGNFKLYKPANFQTTIQAEDYTAAAPVQTGGTGDVGGGLVVGWIDTGDWMTYDDVSIPSAGTYKVEYRVASPNTGGELALTGPYGTPYYGSVTVPNTGGWDTYTTVEHTVTLTAGDLDLVIGVNTGGWNINWFRITKL